MVLIPVDYDATEDLPTKGLFYDERGRTHRFRDVEDWAILYVEGLDPSFEHPRAAHYDQGTYTTLSAIGPGGIPYTRGVRGLPPEPVRLPRGQGRRGRSSQAGPRPRRGSRVGRGQAPGRPGRGHRSRPRLAQLREQHLHLRALRGAGPVPCPRATSATLTPGRRPHWSRHDAPVGGPAGPGQKVHVPEDPQVVAAVGPELSGGARSPFEKTRRGSMWSGWMNACGARWVDSPAHCVPDGLARAL